MDTLKPLAAAAAKKYGIDPRVVETLIGIESSGGRNATPSSAGALGVMQVMPANAAHYHVTPEQLNDPAINIDVGTHLFADNLKETGGDIYKAAAYYNNGNLKDTLAGRIPKETRDYLGSFYQGMNPPSELETLHKHAAKVLKEVDQRKKTPVQIAASVPETRPLAKVWDSLRQHAVWASMHTMENADNVLGAPQRAVAAAAYDAFINHADFKQTLAGVSNAVFHPTDAVRKDVLLATRQLLHQPTPERMHDVLENKFGKAVANTLTPVVMTASSIASQALTDPLTLTGVTEARWGVSVTRAALDIAADVGSKLGEAKAFKPLADALMKGKNGWFTARPELNKYFDPEMKKLRIAAENVHLGKQVINEQRDAKVVGSVQGTQARILEYFAEHGTAQKAKQAQALSKDVTKASSRPTGALKAVSLPALLKSVNGMKEDERAELLKGFRETITPHQIAAVTTKLVKDAKGAGFTGEVSKIKNIPYVPKNLVRIPDNPITTFLTRAAKEAVILNPLPHGGKNVGILAYLAGGPAVVPRALYWMAKSFKNDAYAEVARHANTGLVPTFLADATKGIYHQIPGLKNYVKAMDPVMQHMEFGWRQALLEQLDQKLGKSKDLKDELMKSFMVNDRLGDYRNQSAFVQFFHQIGGPFVAFRLGIVPKNVFRAAAEVPDRVENILRLQLDTSANRQGKKNELHYGGPVEDTAKMLANPSAYSDNSATLGIIYYLIHIRNAISGSTLPQDDPAEIMSNFMRNYLGPINIFGQIINDIEGKDMPTDYKGHFQKMSWADQVLTSIIGTAAAYFEPKTPKKSENKKYKQIKKQDKG
jgi:hypothetical protein